MVTGPTVIHPLLRRIGVNESLHHILHWEGVLIDPIGVFIAVLCFERFSAGSLTLNTLEGFDLRSLVGMGTGLEAIFFCSPSTFIGFNVNTQTSLLWHGHY